MEVIKVQLRLLYWSLSLRLNSHKRNTLALLLCTLVFFLGVFCTRFIHDGRIALVVLVGPAASAMFACLEVTCDLERNQGGS